MENSNVIIKRILKNMPKGLSDLEKARYIYIVLGKEKSYDEEFWFANSRTREKIFNTKHTTKIDFDVLIKNRKVVCTSISKIYSVILKQIGIDNYIEKPDLDDKHIYVVLKLAEKRIIADLQRDLSNIQSNKKTEYFGTKIYNEKIINIFDEIEDSQLRKVDEKIGYISQKKDYTDNDILYLKTEVKRKKDIYSKVDFILKNAKDYIEPKNIGYIELVQYYKWILTECLTEKELKNIISTNCYRENDERKQYISCFSVNTGKGYKRYIYSQKEKRYITIDDEKIQQFMREGLRVVNNNSFPGLKKFKREER